MIGILINGMNHIVTTATQVALETFSIKNGIQKYGNKGYATAYNETNKIH